MRTPAQPIGNAHLPLDQMHPNPDQPRKEFDPEAQRALQLSLSQRGLINPVSVVQRAEGGYLLIAGERRYRAAQALGWKSIAARIWPPDLPPEELEILAIVENLQRQELNPIEEAQAYKVLQDPPLNMSQRNIGRLVGKTQSVVALYLSLLDQPPAIQEMIVRTIISPTQVRYLAKINDISVRLSWAERVHREGWSVQELIKKIGDFVRGRSTDAGPEAFPVSTAIPAAEAQGDDSSAAPKAAPSQSLEADSVPRLELSPEANAAASAEPSPATDLSAMPVQSSGQEPHESADLPVDPLQTCWGWADEVAPAGAAWQATYTGDAHWKIDLQLEDAEALRAQTDLGEWLIAFGNRLLPDRLPTIAPAPAAPQILEATYVNGHRLQLKWTSGGEGFTYRIYRASEDTNPFDKVGDEDLKTTGAIVDCWADPYRWFRLAVVAIDPSGRESALSETVRFDANELNQSSIVQSLD